MAARHLSTGGHCGGHGAWAASCQGVIDEARGVGRGPNTPGNWALAGPSTANFPNVLTFSGASYTTSGRITALAIDPNCTQSTCRVWAAAAGGVTSIVMMPDTDPVIDDVALVEFILRTARETATVNVFPAAAITKQL